MGPGFLCAVNRLAFIFLSTGGGLIHIPSLPTVHLWGIVEASGWYSTHVDADTVVGTSGFMDSRTFRKHSFP